MPAVDRFIPNRDAAPEFHPLRGLLPLLPASVAAEYIAAYSAPGDLILDPFATAPTVARVAQKMERRAIAIESHPLWSWILRALATPPPASAIDSVLTRWGDALKDDAPLRAHIDHLYATVCANCQRATPADYFVRTRGGAVVRRQYTCAHCGVTRAETATEQDAQRAAQFDARGFHFHFAFERVAPAETQPAERIRKILALYSPRALYALVSLTQKSSVIFNEPRERAVVGLLLLYLLNRGTSFYTDPAPDAPARIATHAEYLEFNLWRELERAARELCQVEPIVEPAETAEVVKRTALPRAFVGRGNARALARELGVELEAEQVALVLTQPPVSRVPIWALSYFLGAWVFGRAAMPKLVPYLDPEKDAAWERKWYIETLAREMGALARLVRVDARVVWAFDAARHIVADSVLLSAAGAPLELESFVFQPRAGDFPKREFEDVAGAYRVTFIRRVHAPQLTLSEPELAAQIRAAALAGAQAQLARRSEALAYSWLHHAAYTHVARAGLLQQAAHAKLSALPHVFVATAIREGLREGYAREFDHHESADTFLWRLSAGETETSLSERVEQTVREKLQSAPALAHVELEDALYRQYPAELTPETGLVALCARAYADERAGIWYWRGDAEAERTRVMHVLVELGARLGFETARDRAPFEIAWKDAAGEIAHGFAWGARFADLARVHVAPARGYLLVTDYHVPLLLEKTKRLPHRAERFYEAGWDFARVESIEKLTAIENITREDLIGLAGLTRAASQLELL